MTATGTRLSSATVHEAAGRLGALPSVIKPLSPEMHLATRAFPVRIPPGDNLWLHRAVYAATRGEVLVVDTGGGLEYGYWGEILAEAATTAAEKLKFTPARQGSRSVDAIVQVRVTFTLAGGVATAVRGGA